MIATPEPAKIRTVVADDIPQLRDIWIRLMQRTGRFDVVGQSGDGYSAVDVVLATDPQLLVVDLNMPGLDGLEVIERVRDAGHVELVTVVLSGLSTASYRPTRHKPDGHIDKEQSKRIPELLLACWEDVLVKRAAAAV